MGTLTIKCPDKALDGDEPMKGEVVHWRAKYKQLPSKEMLICNWSVVVQFSCNTGTKLGYIIIVRVRVKIRVRVRIRVSVRVRFRVLDRIRIRTAGKHEV